MQQIVFLIPHSFFIIPFPFIYINSTIRTIKSIKEKTMEHLDNSVLDEHDFTRSAEIQGYLLTAAKWGKFLAIMGYIFIGLALLASIGIFGGSASTESTLLPGTSIGTGVFGMVYLLLIVLYYFPTTYLYRFSVRVRRAVESEDTSAYTSAFENLKSLFKFSGILVIVLLGLYLIAFIVAMSWALV